MAALIEKGIGQVAGWMLLRELRGGVRGVYLRGSLPKPPFVLAMNHHSYFDGHLVYLLFKRFRVKGRLLVSPENLRAFPIFKPLGALEATKVRAALRALEEGEAVAVFPEGELRCHGGLGELKRGAVFLAQKANVPLIPCAGRLFPRGFPRPEIYLWIGDQIEPDLAALAQALKGFLNQMDELFRNAPPRDSLPGFRLVLSGYRGFDERMARISRALGKLFLRKP